MVQLTQIIVVMIYSSRIWLAPLEIGGHFLHFYSTGLENIVLYLDTLFGKYANKIAFYIKSLIFVTYRPIENWSNDMLS